MDQEQGGAVAGISVSDPVSVQVEVRQLAHVIRLPSLGSQTRGHYLRYPTYAFVGYPRVISVWAHAHHGRLCTGFRRARSPTTAADPRAVPRHARTTGRRIRRRPL